MLLLYYKLKLRVYLNRIKNEPTEERFGKITGYALLWIIIAFLGYGVLKLIFASDIEKICVGLLIYFVFVTLINIGDNFKKIYQSLFERPDKYMLYMFPMDNRHIVGINLLDSTWEYMKTYVLLVYPVFFSLVFFDLAYAGVVLALVLGCVCISFVIVCCLTMLLLFTINVTKGKNIKTISLLLTLLFSGLTTLLVYSNRYLKIVENKWLINTLLMPVGYFARVLNINQGNGVSKSIDFCGILIYTIVIVCLYYISFSKSINKGILLIDTEYIINIPISRQLANIKLSKRARNKEYYLSKKDIIGAFSNYDVIKMLASVTIMFILTYRYFLTDIDDRYMGIFLMIKSLIVVVQLMYYLYQYESKNLALIFTISDNVCIMNSKRNTCLKIVFPFTIIFDFCLMLFSQANILTLVCTIVFDAIFVIMITQNCSYNIIQFSQIKNYIIRFPINGLITYIQNIIVIQAPIVLGYWLLVFNSYDKNIGIGRYVLLLCLAGCMLILSFFVMKRKITRVYQNIVEFL